MALRRRSLDERTERTAAWVVLFIILVALGWTVVFLHCSLGCSKARQDWVFGLPSSQPSSQPVAPQGAQQAGQGNLAAQVQAPGWKGIEYNTAVPIGQVALLMLLIYLSHRREMTRLQGRDKHR